MNATRAYCLSKRKATEDSPETIIPGYHMNKKHWNTVYIHKDVEQE